MFDVWWVEVFDEEGGRVRINAAARVVDGRVGQCFRGTGVMR